MDRRAFLEFLGQSTAITLAASAIPAWTESSPRALYTGIQSTTEDGLVLCRGLNSQILLRWGDKLNVEGAAFGFNNDFTAFLPTLNGEGILWVNHEYTKSVFLGGHIHGAKKTREQVEEEMYNVGGSLVQIRRTRAGWSVVPNSIFNRRFTALTPIPFAWPEAIDGSHQAIGTTNNCAGGVTPWRTFLTCEENYQTAYGDFSYTGDTRTWAADKEADYWHLFYDFSPQHYGWVVEINPLSGAAKKLVALGRFCHEGAKVVQAADGRAVVYMGDDDKNQFIYKFIAARPSSLEEGTLYVADTVNGVWLPLDVNQNEKLRTEFKTQTQVLIRTREAARLIGATPQDRPEGIAVDPLTKAVIISLTNNTNKGNLFGSLLRIEEQGSDPLSLHFTASTLMVGGVETGFACPDNVVFDARGNLWMTSDMSFTPPVKPEYKPFGNNGLFVIPRSGQMAGKMVQVASAPVEAEFTGPSLSPDGKTLFLSVQHPGEYSPSAAQPTSHWPDGGTPKPCVVALTGPVIEYPEWLGS